MNCPLLYTYRRCPYAMRARMALLQAGVAFDAHEIVLRDKPAAMLEISPKGTVPVLLLPDGRVIEESLEIMRWAFEERDEAGWWQRANTGANLALIALNDGPFKHHLDRYKYPGRYGGTGSSGSSGGADPNSNQAGDSATEPAGFRDLALACLLAPLNERLSMQPWLGEQTPCAADLAIMPFVRQFRAVDERWFDAQPLQATQRWLQTWLNSALFEACMQKLKPPSAVQ
jgi:glutathione S-transferase